MNTYLKYKPVWFRIFVMGSLIFGVSLVMGIMSLYFITRVTGISFTDFQSPDFTNPVMVRAQKILLPVNSIAVFLVPSLLYAYFADPKPMRFLRLDIKPSWWYWLIAIIIMIIALPSAFWVGELNKHLDLSHVVPAFDKWMKTAETESNKIIEIIIGKQTIKDLFINLLILALLPAVSEEFFFRGLIQKGLIRSTRNVWLGIILSAFIFSAFHLQFLTFLTRFEMGIILGALFWYSGSLWVSIVAHFVFNGIQVLFSYWQPEMVDPPSWTVSAGLVGLSFLIVIALIIILRRTSSVSMSEVFDDDDDDDIIIEESKDKPEWRL